MEDTLPKIFFALFILAHCHETFGYSQPELQPETYAVPPMPEQPFIPDSSEGGETFYKLDFTTLPDLDFSGLSILEDGTKVVECFSQCSTFQIYGSFFESYLISMNKLCFCSAVNATEFCNFATVNIAATECDINITACETDSVLSVHQLSKVFSKNPDWKPRSPSVGENFTIHWSFTEDYGMEGNISFIHQVSIDKDNGEVIHQFSSSKDYIKTSVHDIGAIGVFHLPGYQRFNIFMVMNLNKIPVVNLTIPNIAYVLSSPTSYKLVVPDKLTADNMKDLTFQLNKGTNITVTIKTYFESNEHLRSSLFLVDVPEMILSYGETAIEKQKDILVGSSWHEKLLVYVENQFKHSGTLNRIYLKVDRIGVLKLAILRDTEEEAQTNVTIVATLLILVNKTGYQYIDMSGIDANVQRKDYFALYFTSTSAWLTCSLTEKDGVVAYDVNFFPGVKVDLNVRSGSFACGSCIRVTYTKPFKYYLDPSRITREGIMNVEVTLESTLLPDGVLKMEKTCEIPKDFALLRGLQFVKGYPKTPEEEIYSWKEGQKMQIQVKLDYGSNATITLKVEGFDGPIITLEKNVFYTEQATINFPLGRLKLIASASNGARIIRNTTFIELVKPITDVEIMPNDDGIIFGNDLNFNVVVILYGGSNVTIELDFFDSPIKTKNVSLASDVGTSLSFKHSYTECKEVEVAVTAYNKLLNAFTKITKSKKIKAYCPLKELKVLTLPKITSSKDIYVMPEQELEVKVAIGIGSYVDFIIHWGDDDISYSNTKTKSKVDEYVVKHIYKKFGDYTVKVIAESHGSNLSTTLSVIKDYCAPPTVAIPTSSETYPVQYTEGDNITIKGIWRIPHSNCEKNIEDLFQPDNYYFRPSTEGHKFEKEGNSFVVKIGRKPKGTYNVEIRMIYNNTIFITYNVSLLVTKLNIVAKILGGEKQVVPAKTLNKDQEEISYDLVISAKGSYDPYEKDTGLAGMFVQWTWCNVDEREKCSDDIRKNNDSQVVLNTETLSGVYKFELYIEKGDRNASAKQIVTISEFVLPEVTIECVENCLKFVNTQEVVRYRYKCPECPRKLGLNGTWIVTKKVTGDNFTIDEVITNEGMGTDFNSPNLVIKPNYLKGNSTYKLLLQVRFDGNGNFSEKEYRIETSIEPHSGNCSISPDKGHTQKTKFLMDCSRWESIDKSTLYFDFSYYFPSKNTSAYKLGEELDRTQPYLNNIDLPAGLQVDDHTVVVVAKIYDRFGMSKEVKRFATVYPSEKRVDEMLAHLKETSEWKSIDLLTKAILDLVNKASHECREKVTNLKDIQVDEITNITNKNKEKELEEAKRNCSDVLKEIIFVATEKVKLFFNNDNVIINREDSPVGLVIKSINDIFTVLLVLTEKPPIVSLQSQSMQIDICKHVCDRIGDKLDKLNTISSLDRDFLVNHYVQVISNIDKALLYIAKLLGKTNEHLKPENKEQSSDDIYITDLNDIFESGNNTYQKWNETSEKHVKMKSICERKIQDLVNNNVLVDEEAKTFVTETRTWVFQKVRIGELNEVTIENITIPRNLSNQLNNGSVGDPVLLKALFQTKETTDTGLQQETQEANALNLPKLSSGTTLFKILGKKVHSLNDPIKIKLTDSVVDGTKVTLEHPQDFTTISMEVLKGCDLMVEIDFPELDTKNPIRLTVYMQYAIAPSPENYDIKLEFFNSTIPNVTIGAETAVLPREGKKIQVKRQVNILRKNDMLVLLNVTNFTFAEFARKKPHMHYALKYDGRPTPLLYFANSYTYDLLEVRTTTNVTLRSRCKTCRYKGDSSENREWKDDGVEVDWENTTATETVCKTTHLSTFGSFYVAPNPLPAFSLDLLKEGFVLLVTVLVLLLLWLLGLVIARRIDKKDFMKIGVSPLADNKPGDSYLYEVTVNTGNRRHAGTNSKVFFAMAGVDGKTRMRRLEDPERAPFQTSSVDIFILATAEPLGDLTYIQIWHDNSGGSWYLRSVEVVDLQTEEKDVFLAARWLAVDKLDGRLDCVIHAASDKDLQEFNYLFTSKTRRDFSDAHLWFSVYLRPPRSSFTRCQRLSVAFCLLFTSMFASVMFYGAVPAGNAEEENRIAGFNFRWTQVYIAVICAIITVPINLLLVALFRSIKPDYLKRVSENTIVPNDSRRESTAEIIVSQTEESTAIDFSAKDVEQRDSPKRKREKKFYLPSWCLIPAWILCVTVILACAFFVVWYGMAFGNRKSLDWLASISISLVQDIVLMQPLKVFILALFVALIVKKIDEEEKSELEKETSDFTKDNSWLNKLKEETTVFDRVEAEDLHPPDLSQLGWMREIRIKEVQMYAITREIILYLVFTCLVFIIGYFTRDNDSFLQTRNVEELLSLKPRKSFGPLKPGESPNSTNQIGSSADFWPWMDNVFLQEVFPTPWYKLDSAYDDTPAVKDFPGNVFLNDLNSKIVNGIRLRQVRVKPESCDKAPDVEDIIDLPCAAEYSFSTEETRHFDHNWTLPYEPTDGLTPINKPWRYQTWSELDAYPVWAELDTYFGGGYVVEIFPRWDNPEMLKQLKDRQWIDRYSRAVIIEFTLYNAATNYFNAITIAVEFPPGGGVVPFFTVMTFRLYPPTNSAEIFVIACEVLFLLFMIMFTVREMKLIYRSRWSYFTEFWNLVELSNIFLTLAGVIVYIYRDTLGSDLLSRLPTKRPEKFINFQYGAYVDLVFTYIIALICFFVTLKFIKLLRFNRRISLLSHTLKRAWYPLSMFGVTFSIILTATIISSSLIFGTTLYDYRNVLKTIAPIIGLLLGKFRYHEFEEGNRLLGPVFFLAFNVMVNWIIMNMMIAILTDTFVEVQEEVLAQSNDYEIIDFVVGHFKDWLGLQNSKQAIDELIEENMGQPDDDDSEIGSPSRRPTLIKLGKGKVSTVTNVTLVEEFKEPIFVDELPACLKYTDDDEYTLEELFEMADKCALLFEKKSTK